MLVYHHIYIYLFKCRHFCDGNILDDNVEMLTEDTWPIYVIFLPRNIIKYLTGIWFIQFN